MPYSEFEKRRVNKIINKKMMRLSKLSHKINKKGRK